MKEKYEPKIGQKFKYNGDVYHTSMVMPFLNQCNDCEFGENCEKVKCKYSERIDGNNVQFQKEDRTTNPDSYDCYVYFEDSFLDNLSTQEFASNFFDKFFFDKFTNKPLNKEKTNVEYVSNEEAISMLFQGKKMMMQSSGTEMEDAACFLIIDDVVYTEDEFGVRTAVHSIPCRPELKWFEKKEKYDNFTFSEAVEKMIEGRKMQSDVSKHTYLWAKGGFMYMVINPDGKTFELCTGAPFTSSEVDGTWSINNSVLEY